MQSIKSPTREDQKQNNNEKKKIEIYALMDLHPLGDLSSFKNIFSPLPSFHFSGRTLLHITW